MITININQKELAEIITEINNVSSGVDCSVAKVKDPAKCEGIMITSYVDRIRKLADLMEKYKELLEKDTKEIRTSICTIESVDVKISLDLRQIHGGKGR